MKENGKKFLINMRVSEEDIKAIDDLARMIRKKVNYAFK